MKFTTALITALFSVGALAAPSITKRQDTVTYKIHDFTERKYNGVNISTLFFNIESPPNSGGNIKFECAPFVFPTGKTSSTFEAGHVYFCYKDSPYSFSFVPGDAQKGTWAKLNLWQTDSKTKTYVGDVEFREPPCRAAGPGKDTVCEAQEDYQIHMSVAGSPTEK
ncbi:hypothetical protein EJ03DRAFT_156244 [Teratosphaeria nubilosa]|uniref:AA1-like domain-containing protein n=1 Tax=Teratosphaeria nubilosa TaxID=161662 RepID=A0A6G1L3R0_9PEZI|nr:hypothetical protein EJ03DRAFT_156244 [Teratosphaeria nubilosa]